MIYAGFWLRLGALLVDFLVFLPIIFLYFRLRSISLAVAIITTIPYFLSWTFYNFYLHGYRGQTVGKMVTRIKVVRTNGTSISYFCSFLRYSVYFLLYIILALVLISAYLSIARAVNVPWGKLPINRLLYQNTPNWGHWANRASSVWILCELIILLFNKKKRALHDFIAGTVVIDLRKKGIVPPSSIDERLDIVLSKLDMQ